MGKVALKLSSAAALAGCSRRGTMKKMISSIAPQLLLLLLLSLRSQATFNDQVMGRVIDRLEDFMNVPVDSCQRAANYRAFKGFPNDMEAADRDKTLTALYSELGSSKVYYGLEDGMIIYFYPNEKHGWYREPGNDGYDGFNIPEEMKKYWNTCLDGDTGDLEPCVLDEGAPFIQCWNDCELDRCPDERSQRGCSKFLDGDERRACEAEVKWCPQYTIERVKPGEKRGYVPATTHCLNPSGQFEQEHGMVLVDADTGALGDCLYGDGKTRVERSLAGAYEYCGGNGTVCNNTFVGAYESTSYDPRYRDWYKLSKIEQRPIWTQPYPFVDDFQMGITYTHPIYSMQGKKKIFTGVLAVDYALSVFTDFLQTEYKGTDILVGIFEATEPYYVIGSSTGSRPAGTALADDPSQPCPDDAGADMCQAVRLAVDDLEGNPGDIILQRTFASHKDQGFPDGEFVTAKLSDDVGSTAYISLAQVYEQENANLKWRVIVTTPVDQSDEDAALPGETIFVIICLFGCLGVSLCFCLFVIFYRKRKDARVVHTDWRFTCAFMLGCSALNVSTLTLLGPNSDELCMLRMWSFNFLFTCAISPLFVKVVRMYWQNASVERTINPRRPSSLARMRAKMTSLPAFLMVAPFLVIELVLLMTFSISDPPEERESVKVVGDVILQHLYCDQETRTFFWVQISFHGLLVLVGCVIAFLTRNIESEFGQGKHDFFAMYNIAFTGLIIVTILQVVDMDESGKLILEAIGVLWGTLFSATAFALPFLSEFTTAGAERRRSIFRTTSFVTFTASTVVRAPVPPERHRASLFWSWVANVRDRRQSLVASGK